MVVISLLVVMEVLRLYHTIAHKLRPYGIPCSLLFHPCHHHPKFRCKQRRKSIHKCLQQ